MDASSFFLQQQISGNYNVQHVMEEFNQSSSSSLPLSKRARLTSKYMTNSNIPMNEANQEHLSSDSFFNDSLNYPPPSAYENAMQNIIFTNNSGMSNPHHHIMSSADMNSVTTSNESEIQYSAYPNPISSIIALPQLADLVTASSAAAAGVDANAVNAIKPNRGSSMSREQLFQKLKSLPYQLQRYINLYNLKLATLDYFSLDCQFKSTTMKKSIEGNQKILKVFISLVENFPDFICTVQKLKYSAAESTLTAQMEMIGTNCYNFYDNTLPVTNDAENPIMNSINNNGMISGPSGIQIPYNMIIDFNPHQRNAPSNIKKANMIMQNGKKFKFLCRAEWVFTINDQKTNFCNFFVSNKVMGVMECQD